MFIAGMQKLTLLDFPGVVACTLFTAGCNFRCPWCHNAGLVLPEEALEIVEALGYEPGKVSVDTVAGWNAAIGYVPDNGEIIIYKDREIMTLDGHLVYVPGVKIGSGNAYVQDLAFVDSKLSQTVMSHIADGTLHVTAEEKAFWSNKINVNDSQETVGETLILNRN